MLHDTLISSLGFVIFLILVIVAFMWLGKSWFIQWLKGTAGMLMLFGGFWFMSFWIYGVTIRRIRMFRR